jgi:hypothetical protein
MKARVTTVLLAAVALACLSVLPASAASGPPTEPTAPAGATGPFWLLGSGSMSFDEVVTAAAARYPDGVDRAIAFLQNLSATLARGEDVRIPGLPPTSLADKQAVVSATLAKMERYAATGTVPTPPA